MTIPCIAQSSSLILGSFDLLDYAESPVVLGQGWDRSAAVPTTSQVQAAVLDGAAVVGLGAGNRSPSIPVTVHGATRLAVAQLVNEILAFVGQPTWQMTFTPAGGYPVVYDCYRATVTITSGIRQEDQALAQSLLITCSALPYGRSPATTTVLLAGAPLLIDAFDAPPLPAVTAIDGTVSTLSNVSTPVPPQGTKSLQVPFAYATTQAGDVLRTSAAFRLTRTGLALTVAGDLSGIRVAMRENGTAAYFTWQATVTVTASGVTYTASRPVAVTSGIWTQAAFDFPTAIPNGSTITGYTIEVSASLLGSWGRPAATGPTVMYFDGLIAYPAASNGVSDAQGVTLHLNGVCGSARTPISLALTQAAAGTFKSWCVHAAPPDRPDAQPLVPFGGQSGASVSVTVPATARYGGTYSLWVACGVVASPGTPRTWAYNITQGTGTPVVASSGPVTPVSNSLVYLGDVVLPTVDYPDEAALPTVITLASTMTADVFNDVLLLDTRGQTILVDSTATAKAHVWVDAPDPTVAIGGVWSGAAADRSDASSVAAHLRVAGTLLATPGDSTLLVFSPEGALAGTATYSARWQQDATS